MLSANEALERLKEGNARFVAGTTALEADQWPARRQDLVQTQRPFAVVLGCSDSRLPVETIFDQGIGDLFVIRVAGNVAASTQLGSIEYALQQLGSNLVVVLGHHGCGAVQATLQHLENPDQVLSPNIQKLVDLILPAVHDLEKPTVNQVVERHSQLVAAGILRQVKGLADPGSDKGWRVVAATYHLESGQVAFTEPH